MDKYIGRLLDNRYEILEVIGTGGMAVVYKARCHRLNRLVAIKILKDDYLEDEEFRRRFHSESQAVAMLSHPNIVSVYDVSSSITADYIVMELIDGITLKQYMEKKGVLNWKETLHFAIQISKALEHAHSRGIVHRDIKPHNVMVLKNGAVKVTDFGIARMMSKGNTLTKEALGSVHYISPEQAKGGRVDSRSDIYSLGVVMYEMMSGRPPYDGESPVAVAIQHINGGAVMPSTLNPNIPGGLEQIIMKAMAHEPEGRYASATQMLSDMDEFRKSPAILFDYNTPPIDAVTKMPKPPLVLDTPQKPTTAERVAGAEGNNRPVRRTADSAAGNKQRPARRRPSAKEEEKRSKTATIAIIACSAVMVVAVVIFLVVLLSGGMNAKPEMVDVPNLVGKIYEELPEYADINIKKDKEVHDEEIPAGQIISQEPVAGVQIEKNKDVYVTISLGKEMNMVFMPDLVDWELEQAKKTLNNLDLDLKFSVKKENHDTIVAGNIIRTEPEAEIDLEEGQTITLYVSDGIEIKNGFMPSLVGDTKEIAEKILNDQELALEIAVEEVFDSVAVAGTVVRTEPASGESLQTAQKVTLYISKGPQLAEIKNVIGMQADRAVTILKNEGFGNYDFSYIESAEEKDTVVGLKIGDKKVLPGESVDVNAKVILEVSKGSGSASSVTKDVTISLQGKTAAGESLVIIIRDNVEVFRQTVAKGQDTVVLKGQTGSGIVEYKIIVEDAADAITWTQRESF